MILMEAYPLPAGTVYMAILYNSVIAQYQQLAAVYSTIAPSSSEVLSITATAFQGALAANSSLVVSSGNTVTSGWVAPPCPGAICQQSVHALAGNTPYVVSCALAHSTSSCAIIDVPPLLAPPLGMVSHALV